MGRVVVWVVEGTWEACVDAAAARSRPDDDVMLLHVRPADVEQAAHGAFSGLMGRHNRADDPGDAVARIADEAGRALLEAARRRLAGLVDRRIEQRDRFGRVEREVVAACEGAALLVLARDGDPHRLGPRSLGPATRFVVDHAPCPVLLVWPGITPGLESIPPPKHPKPPKRPKHPRPEHGPHPHPPGPPAPPPHGPA